MKRIYRGIFHSLFFIIAVFVLCGCELLADESDEAYQAARIMCDIDSAINLHTEASEDELKQSLYDFSDIFSDEAYRDMGDLTDTYTQICSYFGTWLETFDLQKAVTEGNTLKVLYKIECADKSAHYIYFIADISDSFHKKGVRFLHIADNMETAEKGAEAEYGIYLNGTDICLHDGQTAVQFREEPVVYKHKKDYGGGDANALAKEVADEFVNCLRQKDADKIKNMFSGSVWRYDTQLESEIETFMEAYADLSIESYEVSQGSESGSTSYGSLPDSEGGRDSTHGHGAYSISLTIEMETNQGEREIDLQVVSEYEPNPGRVGVVSMSDGKVNVGF